MTEPLRPPLKLVVLISGGGTNLQALIDAAATGELDIDIRSVISNRPSAYGLERARNAGISGQCIDHRQYADRTAFETSLAAAIDTNQPELVVLAGFMRILGDDFVNRYSSRMINLHPSLLPDFPGLNTYERALQSGVKQHGASIHFVTPELDGGPVISQITIPVLDDDSASDLQQRLAPLEHRLVVYTVDLFADRRLQCIDNRVIFDGEPLQQPLRLNYDPDSPA